MASPSGDSKLAKLYCIQPVYGEKAVGTVDKVAAAVVDVTIRVDKTRIAGADHARRAKNEDRFYSILILNLLLYAACIIHHHRHNLQQTAFLP